MGAHGSPSHLSGGGRGLGVGEAALEQLDDGSPTLVALPVNERAGERLSYEMNERAGERSSCG